jgi:hypothetical protein
MTKGKRDIEQVVYPDIELTLDDIKNYYNMREKDDLQDVLSNAPVVDELKNELADGFISSPEFELVPDAEELLELTEEQKREFLIEQLKQSKIKFKPIVHRGNVTVNQFDAAYKKKRQNRNKMQKQSRKNNRKK